MVQIKLFPFITTALIVEAGRGCLDWHLATSVLLFLGTEFGLFFLLTILSFLSHNPLNIPKCTTETMERSSTVYKARLQALAIKATTPVI